MLTLSACALICVSSSSAQTTDAAESATPSFRLPQVAHPTHYTLDLTLDPGQTAFHGIATIAIELTQPTKTLWLNQKDLTIRKVTVRSGKDAGRGSARAASFVTPDEFLGITFPRRLPAGPITLEIAWDGSLNDQKPIGPFRKQAKDDWYIYTSFTPIDARRAFPGFDEPGYKCPWSVTIHAPAADVAVTNGPELSATPEPNGMKLHTFKETQPLAAEVVAFAVGPFDVVDAGTAGEKHVPVRVITPRGRGVEAGPAAKAAADIIPREEAYTGIPYPWDKLDHIAVIDLPFGATENPGLITYRDSGLLAPPDKDTPRRIQSMRQTMTHELAHQWFGNLVTQAWWNETYLAEGFATWMEAKITDQQRPADQLGLSLLQARDRIMVTDAKATRPVRVDPTNRTEANDAYNQIVYQKGAATIKMIEDWIGPDAFQRGIRQYLHDHAYANATTAELEQALQQASGIDVAPVMDDMLNRTGFATLQFKVEGGKLLIDQNAQNAQDAASTTSPHVLPVCIRSESTPKPVCQLVNTAHTEIPFGDAPVATAPAGRRPAPQPWVDTNAFGSGYYRSVLSPAMSDALIDRAWTELTEAQRLAVAVDLKAQANRATP
jgi:alanyl aminopeptidase